MAAGSRRVREGFWGGIGQLETISADRIVALRVREKTTTMTMTTTKPGICMRLKANRRSRVLRSMVVLISWLMPIPEFLYLQLNTLLRDREQKVLSIRRCRRGHRSRDMHWSSM